jgi:tetratricopeptide (TPR) repeat protein
MTDSSRPNLTDPNLEDRIDRYVRRELTAAEARELAQASLDSPELFEELTFSALAKTALSSRSVPGGKILRFPGKGRFFAAGAIAAAAVVLVSLYLVRSSPLRQTQNPSHETAAGSQPKPALGFSANPSQPVLLASALEAGPGRADTQVFRSAEPASRSPRPAGEIVSIEDGLAAIDLGSLDGLAKGSELRIFRDERSTQPIGRLMVTTVFRERARGRILEGREIQVHNQVRVAGTAHLGALLEQVDALSNRGDSDAARSTAEKAAGWAETANVPPGETRKALARLAALEYQAGSLQAAEMHYRSAVESLNQEPAAPVQEQAAAFNNLAVLRLLNGNYDGAEAPLSQAVAKSPKTDIVYGRSVNNLAVLAELRGDRRKAEALYADAQRALAGIADSPAQERRVVEANLARIRGLP